MDVHVKKMRKQNEETTTRRELPEPTVAPAVYDRKYYLTACGDYKKWAATGGREVASSYKGVLEFAGFRPGENVLDVGTGRGEIVRVAIENGAAEAVGIDYSDASIELARQTLSSAGIDDVELIQADARRLPFKEGRFDLVMALDVVEHMSEAELKDALNEIHRVLAPGGRVFIHTMPSRLIYDVSYRLLRALRPGWPADPRVDYERAMHVTEHSIGTIKRAMRRSGFERIRAWPGDFLYTDFLPGARARRLFCRLAPVPGVRRFVIADLFAEGYRQG